MMGLTTMLKAFGVNVQPEHIVAVERLIPELPTRLKQAVEIINQALLRADEQLTRQAQLMEAMERRLQLLEDRETELIVAIGDLKMEVLNFGTRNDRTGDSRKSTTGKRTN